MAGLLRRVLECLWMLLGTSAASPSANRANEVLIKAVYFLTDVTGVIWARPGSENMSRATGARVGRQRLTMSGDGPKGPMSRATGPKGPMSRATGPESGDGA